MYSPFKKFMLCCRIISFREGVDEQSAWNSVVGCALHTMHSVTRSNSRLVSIVLLELTGNLEVTVDKQAKHLWQLYVTKVYMNQFLIWTVLLHPIAIGQTVKRLFRFHTSRTKSLRFCQIENIEGYKVQDWIRLNIL